MLNKYISYFLVAFFVTGSAMAQDHQPLAHFHGMQTGKVIQLTFVILAGNKCDGVRIMRSQNDHDFMEIGQLTGVCGNSSTDETYSFTDISPVKNADNFYQLDLTNHGASEVIKIHFSDFGDKGYVLYPNPVVEKSFLYFQNDCNDEFDFIMSDKHGKKVKEIRDARKNSIEIIKGSLKSGNYNFQLFIDNKLKYSGSVTVK